MLSDWCAGMHRSYSYNESVLVKIYFPQKAEGYIPIAESNVVCVTKKVIAFPGSCCMFGQNFYAGCSIIGVFCAHRGLVVVVLVN